MSARVLVACLALWALLSSTPAIAHDDESPPAHISVPGEAQDLRGYVYEDRWVELNETGELCISSQLRSPPLFNRVLRTSPALRSVEILIDKAAQPRKLRVKAWHRVAKGPVAVPRGPRETLKHRLRPQVAPDGTTIGWRVILHVRLEQPYFLSLFAQWPDQSGCTIASGKPKRQFTAWAFGVVPK